MSEHSMSDQQGHIDLSKETSNLTNPHLSQLSSPSNNIFDEFFKENQYQQNSLAHQKHRSKVNSKNYRERKRGQTEHMKRQIEELKEENQYLRSQKYCRWCNRPFDHQVLIEKQSYVQMEVQKKHVEHVFIPKSKTFEIQHQFQKPNLNITKNQEKRGKIWMALGLLMLVLGLTLHGCDGNGTTVKQIELQKEQVNLWIQQMNSQETEYLEVNMGIKEKQYSKMDPGQLKIIYKTQQSERKKDYQESRVSFNRELLLGIQAQIDDIGFYL